MLRSTGNIRLENLVYDGVAENALQMALLNGTTFDVFYLIWILYYYVPNYSKYFYNLFPNGLPPIPDALKFHVNLETIKKNKNNLDDFLNELDDDDFPFLAHVISQHNPIEIKEKLFSLSQNNSSFLKILKSKMNLVGDN